MGKALSARQRRQLARLDRMLVGDVVLTQLIGLFVEPSELARRRPNSRLRNLIWCGLLVVAGIVATVLGAVWASVVGVGATIAVIFGATAIAAGLAVMLTLATIPAASPSRIR
jgi:hypothetical protein